MNDKSAAKSLRDRATDIPRGNVCGSADRKALRRMAIILERGDHKKALEYGQSMDTACREYVPDKVWHYLRVKVAGGVRTVTAHIRLKNCKKVFKKGFRPGVVSTIDLEFPADVPEDKLGLNLMLGHHKVLDEVVEVVYAEGDTDLCVMKAGDEL